MSRALDIRTTVEEDPITLIRFADEFVTGTAFRQADVMTRDGGSVRISESGNHDYVRVYSKTHAKDMIAALEKAIDLGWIK